MTWGHSQLLGTLRASSALHLAATAALSACLPALCLPLPCRSGEGGTCHWNYLVRLPTRGPAHVCRSLPCGKPGQRGRYFSFHGTPLYWAQGIVCMYQMLCTYLRYVCTREIGDGAVCLSTA
ncbi:hypothetical protein B0T24DRAFT_607131 [Lasiosphaeria ovina]|uniref:Secreted protein n=1 Tax=Lasiosphaeria ovina TaxID=92902 RepID=A0AAE0TYF1_9PEZI|nr:hypothetical protein B0T24DRAFT_607131 [Lasiosphaeria ovina]